LRYDAGGRERPWDARTERKSSGVGS